VGAGFKPKHLNGKNVNLLPETGKPHKSIVKRPGSGNLKSGIGKIRHRVQMVFFVLTVAIGLQFLIFVYQALHNDAITVPRPPGVEKFLPIGALMGWKFFVASGTWDPVHPAAMVILGFAGRAFFPRRRCARRQGGKRRA